MNRPINKEERERAAKALADAKDRQIVLNQYIAKLEKYLTDGVEWASDDGFFKEWQRISEGKKGLCPTCKHWKTEVRVGLPNWIGCILFKLPVSKDECERWLAI